MSSLLLEVRPPRSAGWHPVTMLGPGDQPYQLSIMTDSGRDVILFRCDGTRAVIYRSVRALSITDADRIALDVDEVHMVDPEQPVAELAEDRSVFELVCQPVDRAPFDARWTFRAYD